MKELTVHVANCTIGGHETTSFPDGSWIKDKVVFDLDGLEVILSQDRKFLNNRDKLKQGKSL